MLILFSIIEFIACFLQILCLFLFVECFLVRTTKIVFFQMISVSAISYLLTCVLESYINGVLASIMVLVLQVVFINLSFTGKILPKTVFVIIFNILDIAFGTLTYSIFSYKSNTGIPLTTVQPSAIRVYYILSTFLFELVFIYYLKKYRQYKSSLFTDTESYISLIFFLCDFMIMICTYLLYSKTAPYSINLAIVCCSISAFMMICTFFVLLLLHRISIKNDELLSQEILKTHIEEQKKLLKSQHQQATLTRYLRHDLKNILLNYQILLADNKTEEVKKDIEERIGHISSNIEQNYSDNAILNSLLQSKLVSCNDNDIKVTINAFMPSNYQNLDLFVIISNLIDNAIEAEAKLEHRQKEINIHIYTENNQIGIIIRNRIDSSVLNKNPNFKTEKSDHKNHGIGLQSVRYYVEKNNGLIDFFEENGYFGVHIIISLS